MSRIYLGSRPYYGRLTPALAASVRAARSAGASVVLSRIRGGFAIYALV